MGLLLLLNSVPTIWMSSRYFYYNLVLHFFVKVPFYTFSDVLFSCSSSGNSFSASASKGMCTVCEGSLESRHRQTAKQHNLWNWHFTLTPIKNIQRLTQPAHVAQITCLALNDSRSYLLSAQVHCGGPDPVLINLQRSFAAYFKENYMSSICREAHMVLVPFPFFLSLFEKLYSKLQQKKTKQKK